ncbi:MAG: SUMF1/EgtB/PvdO family nonheme iron enzyme, partial [Pirellulales bacterium]|nr:SUMF1/EgtB/PvdO family nonheme iron enzyme [Pirellulales bacterium]
EAPANEYIAQVALCDAPSVRKIDPSVHVHFAKICDKCLARWKFLRYPDAAALERDLLRFHRGLPPEEATYLAVICMVRHVRRYGKVAASVLAAILCTVIFSYLFYLGQRPLVNLQTWSDSLLALEPNELAQRSDSQEITQSMADHLRTRLASASSPQEIVPIVFVLSKAEKATESDVSKLFDVLPDAMQSESYLLVETLAHIDTAWLSIEFNSRISDPSSQVSLVVAAACAGFEHFAAPICKPDEDQHDRYTFLSSLSQCELSEDVWLRCLDTTNNELRSCVIVAVAEALERDGKRPQKIANRLQAICGSTNHGGTRGATEYALRKLGLADNIGVADPTKQSRWFTESGMTMIYIPGGELNVSENGARRIVKAEESFYVSATEVPLSLVAELFKNDPAFQHEVDGLPNRVSNNVSAHQVRLGAAMESCNRLSERSGRTKYYGKIDLEDPLSTAEFKESNGYRLPTRTQWEWMCRSRTTTEYFHGGINPPAFGWFVDESASSFVARAGGLKRPNAFGVFDVYGNVAEFAKDNIDGFVVCGGAGIQPPADCTSSRSDRISEPSRGVPVYGIRIVCPVSEDFEK